MKIFFTLLLVLIGQFVSAQQPCSTLRFFYVQFNFRDINVDVWGGNPPYTYSWNDGVTTEDRRVSTPGNYCLTVTDAQNCRIDTCVTVNAPCALPITLTRLPSAWNDYIWDLRGGTPPFTFSWTDGAGGLNRQGLLPGHYCLRITDANGCRKDTCFVNIPPCVPITVTRLPSAWDDILIDVRGGIPPFTYLWSNGQTFQNIRVQLPGTYCVQIRDANGCRKDTCFTVISPCPAINIARQPSVWNEIRLNVTGGTAPYTYRWGDGPATTMNRTALQAGTYCVSVTDANGCVEDTCFNVVNTARPCGVPILQPPYRTDGANINLSWLPMTGVGGYQVSWRRFGSGSWTNVTVNNGNITSYVIQNLRRNTTYVFRIRAKCNGRWTAWATDQATTTN